MNVVAYVARACRVRLESALSDSHSLRTLTSLEDLQRELDDGHADVGVIDLDSCREGDMRLLTAIASRHGPAVIGYGVFAPDLVRRMVALARHGLCHIVYRGVDDLPANLRRAVNDAGGTRLSAEILECLSPMLCRASAPLRDAIAELFYEPLRFRCAADVAQTAGITRRSLDRTLCRLELEPGRTFLLAARVAWAYPRMRSARVRVSDVSQQLGISKPERFAHHTRLLLGLPPSAVRTRVTPEQFVQMIVVRLRRQPRPTATGVACEHRGIASVSPAVVRPGEYSGLPGHVGVPISAGPRPRFSQTA